MSTKTERITILGSPEFKEFLVEEAKNEKISVSELVRRRCERAAPDADEEVLFAELVAELESAVKRAKRSLNKGLKDASRILAELQAGRADKDDKQARAS